MSQIRLAIAGMGTFLLMIYMIAKSETDKAKAKAAGDGDSAAIKAVLADNAAEISRLRNRVEVLERLAFTFDESLSGSEDYDFCLRVAEVTQLANLAQPVYQYRQHRASVSQSREPEQLARKAVALEHAICRRFGIPPADVLQTVSRDFVTAAVMAHMNASSGHPDEWMGRALRLDPSVLDDAGWLAKVIRSSASVLPTSLQLARIDSLFQTLLPRGRSSWTLHRRLKAEVHMKEVFEAGDVADRVRVRGHLWSAIRSNPLWVANRGVLSLLMRNVLDRRPEGSRSGR